MTVIFSIGLSHCSIERRYSGGAGLMKMLSPEEMQELRNEIADFAISESRKDEIIHFLDAIAASFIHQAFRKSSVQLSLSDRGRSEEHKTELQSIMRISYAVFCLKK